MAYAIFKTNFTRALWRGTDYFAKTTKRSSLRRIGMLNGIAGAVVSLAPAAGVFITGQILSTNGGRITANCPCLSMTN